MQVLLKNFRNFYLNRTMAYYAVANGHKIGIYQTWKECEIQVKGFPNASFKKFKTKNEAELFIQKMSGNSLKRRIPIIEAPSMSKISKHTTESTLGEEYWPDCDGDNYDENGISEDDLLIALYEVEGIPEKNLKSLNHMVIKTIRGLEFQLDNDGYVIVYTDGSCLNNGQANACAGYGVYYADDHPLNASEPVTGRVTNNVGEIQAVIHSIRNAIDLGIEKLRIYTDSMFLINATEKWITAWKRKNWHLKNGDPVKNAVDFKVLDELLSKSNVDVKFKHVRGHQGVYGNEMADKLARAGSAAYKNLKK